MQAKKKNRVIIVLAVIVAFMAVGYAILQQQLTINGTGNIDTRWDVKITNIESSFQQGAKNATNEEGTEILPTYEDTTATFNASLPVPGSEADYTITVTNKGNIPAKLVELPVMDTINGEEPTQILYDVFFTNEEKYVLQPDESVQITVAVSWDPEDDTGVTDPVSKQATITLNYQQEADTSVSS